MGFPVAQLVKNLPAMKETWARSPGWEDPLEKGKATHSSILTWRIPRTTTTVHGVTVRHDWATFTFISPLKSHTIKSHFGFKKSEFFKIHIACTHEKVLLVKFRKKTNVIKNEKKKKKSQKEKNRHQKQTVVVSWVVFLF